MKIIKINATYSTNDFLKDFIKDNPTVNDIVVFTHDQKNGKGQNGTSWFFEKDKSLAFSILKKNETPKNDTLLKLNLNTSLAILEALKGLGVKNLAIKWPNDILAGQKKIVGILIESIWSSNTPLTIIIGIGVNVNNEKFEELPRASSLKLQGYYFTIDEVFNAILNSFEAFYNRLQALSLKELINKYENNLYLKDAVGCYQLNNKIINAINRGITTKGQLQLELENGEKQNFNLKEIQLLY